jgi:hypothetical protein
MVENEQAFYEIYAVIFDQPFTPQKKNVLFTALMGGQAWSWRVIGITAAALEELAKHDFRHKNRLFCRAHLVERIETAKEFFTRKISRNEFFNRFLEMDRTVIVLKSENRKGGPPSYVPIDLHRKLFPGRQVNWRHGQEERAYLRELYAAYKTGKVVLKTRPEELETGITHDHRTDSLYPRACHRR